MHPTSGVIMARSINKFVSLIRVCIVIIHAKLLFNGKNLIRTQARSSRKKIYKTFINTQARSYLHIPIRTFFRHNASWTKISIHMSAVIEFRKDVS